MKKLRMTATDGLEIHARLPSTAAREIRSNASSNPCRN
jgi:hypothetical protein